MDWLDDRNKQRIVQELVPGKQITLAHIIASPDPILYEKLGLDPGIDYARAAIGIMTVSPVRGSDRARCPRWRPRSRRFLIMCGMC